MSLLTKGSLNVSIFVYFHKLWQDILSFRELREECGLESNTLEKIGLLKFEFVGDPQLLEVHVFTTEQFTGTVEESSGTCPYFIP